MTTGNGFDVPVLIRYFLLIYVLCRTKFLFFVFDSVVARSIVKYGCLLKRKKSQSFFNQTFAKFNENLSESICRYAKNVIYRRETIGMGNVVYMKFFSDVFSIRTNPHF